ncbi:hypothetical protein B0H12DRAFT_578253 [Mycena haematopus]|nr:hypothetical protein B0H12DRAFT_578253 [Mycena haematopus]
MPRDCVDCNMSPTQSPVALNFKCDDRKSRAFQIKCTSESSLTPYKLKKSWWLVFLRGWCPFRVPGEFKLARHTRSTLKILLEKARDAREIYGKDRPLGGSLTPHAKPPLSALSFSHLQSTLKSSRASI